MPNEVRLPYLAQGMESGTIVRWLKNEGDTVAKGDPLYELDTDKVTQEVEAPFDGVLLKIAVSEGEAPVGAVVAFIGEAGEEVTLPEPAGLGVEVPLRDFMSAVAKVSIAASTDPERPLITGIWITRAGAELMVAATDSYRACVAVVEVLGPAGTIEALVEKELLAGALAALSSSSDRATLHASSTSLRLTVGPRTYEYPMIALAESYRDVATFIAKLMSDGHVASAIVDRDALRGAVSQAQLELTGHQPLVLRLGDGELSVTSHATAVFGHWPIEYAGEPMTVGVNASYFADGLDATNDAADVHLSISGALNPLLITNSRGNPRYVLMPVSLADDPRPVIEALPEHQFVDETLSDVLAELDELIGLHPVKGQVQELTAFLRVQALRQERGLPSVETTQHLVFVGNPGTGKTTVARLIGRIYRAMGLLSSGHLVEADRSALVAEFLGQTATKTNAVIDRSRDGVLFIDEAYSITHAAAQGDFYGREAIDTLLKRMEDERGRLVVIVAGYPTLMSEFLESNPGLRSRFARTILFPDYADDELLAILQKLCADHGYEISAGDEVHVRRVLARTAGHEGFGNARYVRNLFEAALNAQAVRLTALAQISDDQLRILTWPDFEAALRVL